MFWSDSRSRRAFLYLLEPALIAIAVILMLAFVPKVYPSQQPRLLELHGQDVLATIQKDGSIDRWLAGDPTDLEKGLSLLHELNPNYRHHFTISDGPKTLFTSGTPLKGITVRRTFISQAPLTLELTISL